MLSIKKGYVEFISENVQKSRLVFKFNFFLGLFQA